MRVKLSTSILLPWSTYRLCLLVVQVSMLFLYPLPFIVLLFIELLFDPSPQQQQYNGGLMRPTFPMNQ